MALAERLARLERKPLGWAEWLISLTPEDRQALDEAGRDRRIGIMAILEEVIAEGGPRSKDSIRRWREDLLRDAR